MRHFVRREPLSFFVCKRECQNFCAVRRYLKLNMYGVNLPIQIRIGALFTTPWDYWIFVLKRELTSWIKMNWSWFTLFEHEYKWIYVNHIYFMYIIIFLHIIFMAFNHTDNWLFLVVWKLLYGNKQDIDF